MYSGDFKNIVFRRVISANLGEVSLDRKMLTVLMEIDGVKTAGVISANTGLDFPVCAEVMKKLARINLIESVGNDDVEKPKGKALDSGFIKIVLAELSLAVGPIAEVIFEDEVADMGEAEDSFPQLRAAELVNRLAAQIPRDDKKIAFKQAMASAIKSLKIS